MANNNIVIGSSSAPDSGSGINSYCKEVSEELMRSGCIVHYLSPAPSDRSWLESNNIKHLSVGQGDSPKAAVDTILGYIKENNISAIINNDNAHIQNAAPFVRIPFISVVHLGETNILSLAKWNSQWVDYLVAISNQMKQTLTLRHAIQSSKVPIIYNGIRDPFRLLDLEAEPEYRVVFNGGSNKRKGADLLLKSVTKFPKGWEGFCLDWYGSLNDEYDEALAKLPFVKRCGRVSREDMITALEKADIFLLPSRKEGCPMAMIEAMAAGNICIASTGEGAMDVMVTHGENGFVCNLSKWSEEVVDILGLLGPNKNRILQMKKKARQQYLDRFQVGHTVKRLQELIKTPTVDRASLPDKAMLVRWHRPLIEGTNRAPFLDRIKIKFGMLTKDRRFTPIEE